MIGFTAEIYKLGINPVVDPPVDVIERILRQAGRSRGPIPVRGNLNGADFIQTIVRYGGKWRLYVNRQMLRESGLRPGDTAKIRIEFDGNPRDVPIPGKLSDAFEADSRAKAAFEELTPSRRKEILRYIGSLKTEKAIERTIARVLNDLREHSQSGGPKR